MSGAGCSSKSSTKRKDGTLLSFFKRPKVDSSNSSEDGSVSQIVDSVKPPAKTVSPPAAELGPDFNDIGFIIKNQVGLKLQLYQIR